MNRRQVIELLDRDPQLLIDTEEQFEFNEVPGKVVLTDGVAAGRAWYGFRFVDGPYAGKVVYCYEQPGPRFEYVAHACDDGLWFNVDPDMREQDCEDCGGDYVPELDGKMLTIKEVGS